MIALDATGLFALEEVAKQLLATKRTLILHGAHTPSDNFRVADQD